MTDNALAMAQSALALTQSLQASVTDLSIRVASLAGEIQAQGGTVTPNGQTVTMLTNTIQSESGARTAADTALARRVDNFRADAAAASALTARVAATEEPTLEVDPGKAIEPLRLGKVTFYGESARVIRDAQAVLQAAGAGQLEVVKRANEQGEPFVVIDGQVFVSRAMVKGVVVDPVRLKVRLEVDEKGQYYAAGFGVGVEQAAGSAAEAPFDAGQLLSEITKQITESELVANLDSRIAENRSINDRLTSLSLDLVTAKSRADQRIEALQAQIDNLQGKIYS